MRIYQKIQCCATVFEIEYNVVLVNTLAIATQIKLHDAINDVAKCLFINSAESLLLLLIISFIFSGLFSFGMPLASQAKSTASSIHSASDPFVKIGELFHDPIEALNY